ncbi:dihydrofolate reductase family protein [Actinomycetospora lemnae]|uniref:Dihydrofolate reductase family protein n=1 Tax=Actinomycetospora lemnae TaxID=3019891 RepID=A0ABT5SXM9_9PSEU|nr:dihydrofolate reductase family protein [Actinomycetospora sp. DW7H6]MDD7967618.1 dihydrofolate reductase family protein [Actinomycetospora sp. DW7H6]
MPALIYSATASLDGFIAGPGGDMSWLTEHLGGENEAAERVLARTGAILVGRVTFGGDDPHRGTDKEGAFEGQYDGPVVVLTHRPPDDPPSACSPDGVEFATDLVTAVDRAKELAGDRDVNVLGADVAAQCLAAGLLDEVLMFFAPVLLGDGTPMFRHAGGTRVRLERLPGETEQWYRVVR